MSDDFVLGLIAGVLGSAILYLGIYAPIWRMYQNWVKQLQAPDKPQAVVQTTKDTPSTIVGQAQRARMAITIFWIVLVAVGVLIAAWINPRIWVLLRELIRPAA
ncbi:MAG: hypothetical protein R2873_02900 [Caldilineaceae bacterium]|nr:hypothetical protein [Caldilineaceae bacterium]